MVIFFIGILLYASMGICMENHGKYLDVCPGRLAYTLETMQQSEEIKEEKKKIAICCLD